MNPAIDRPECNCRIDSHRRERDAQPDGFSCIPAAAWWGIAALTTVGYGALAPLTPFEKLAGSAVAILGVSLRRAVRQGPILSALRQTNMTEDHAQSQPGDRACALPVVQVGT